MMGALAIWLGVLAARFAARRGDAAVLRTAGVALVVAGAASRCDRLGLAAGLVESVWIGALAAIAITFAFAVTERWR